MKWLLFLAIVSLFTVQSPACLPDDNVFASVYGNSRIDLDKQSVTSGFNDEPESINHQTTLNLKNDDSSESLPARELTLQQYITPGDEAVRALAGGMNELKDIYDTAGRWVYISDEYLNLTADKWLTPHEFLIDSPYYPGNPLQGKAVGDCEEKANTLVSLVRAWGIRPEEVRVVLGEVTFNGLKTGHAWVEIYREGQWLPLDPSWGPYWNEKSGKVVNRKAVPFDYYAGHDYPVVQVWVYYNDIYYLDSRNGAGVFPDSWSQSTSS